MYLPPVTVLFGVPLVESANEPVWDVLPEGDVRMSQPIYLRWMDVVASLPAHCVL